MSVVRQASISGSDWIDYIFTKSYTLVKWLTSQDLLQRRRGYIWHLYTEQPDAICVDWFNRIQKFKWFLWRWQNRKRRVLQRNESYINSVDLLGEPINDATSLSLCMNGKKYRYSLQDVIGIMKMTLETRVEFSSEPKQYPMDPYTNQTWKLPILYKVSGWIRKQNCTIRELPLSVCMWSQIPYLTMYHTMTHSSPYLISEHLSLQAKYAYIQDAIEDVDVYVQELKIISETVNIPYHRVNWQRVYELDSETIERIWRPFILTWYHPHSEWYGDMDDRDIRSREWKSRMMRLYRVCGCWNDDRMERPVFRRMVYRRHLYI